MERSNQYKSRYWVMESGRADIIDFEFFRHRDIEINVYKGLLFRKMKVRIMKMVPNPIFCV